MGITVESDRDSDPTRHGSGYFYTYHPAMSGGDCHGRFDEICNDCNRWDEPDYPYRLQVSMEPSCSSTPEQCYWGETFKPAADELAADRDRFVFPKGE